MAETQLALAIDLGGTRTRVALVGRNGEISSKQVSSTLAQRGREDVVARLLATVESVAARARDSLGDSLVGVGVSQAGPTDRESGVANEPPNLPGWDGFSIKPVLEEMLAISASVANDASLAALAEHVYGAGRGHANMLYMTVSTGIGGGIIIHGKLYTGSQGFAGELGHIIIDRNGPPCGCGSVGCLEALASGTALARMARERLAQGETGRLVEACGGDLEKLDAVMVTEAARDGDPLARDLVRQVSANLGVGIVSLVNAFDPEVVVIGGGMSNSLDLFMPGIAAEMDRPPFARLRQGVSIVRSELGDDAGLLGAAALAFEEHDRKRVPG